MSKISELSDGGVIQGGDTLIAVRSGGNVKVTYGGSTTANIDGGTIDGTVIGGTTPAAVTGTTITGTSFVSSGDMTFGDSDKAIFGAGSDLQIYHDGSHSIIADAGSGNLQIRANDFQLLNAANTQNIIRGYDATGAVSLHYGGAEKLATSSSGVYVTGTVTADGLTVETSTDTQGKFSGWSVIGANSSSGAIELGQNSAYQGIMSYVADGNTRFLFDNTYGSTGSTFEFRTNTAATAKTHLKVEGSGDISFYEDTGTTAKFFWDASAESLGIGTSSPVRKIQTEGTGVLFANTGGTHDVLFGDNAYRYFSLFTPASPEYMSIRTGSTDLLTVKADGNVDIAGTATADKVTIGTSSASNAKLTLEGVDGGDSAGIYFNNTTATNGKSYSLSSGNSGEFMLYDRTSSAYRLFVSSAGNVGIGVSTPSNNHANANNLVVGNGTAGGIANYVGTGLGWYAFSRANANNSDAYDGGISYDGSRNLMFHTNAGVERMRIDSSGNLLVGRSSAGAAATDNGHVFYGSGQHYIFSNATECVRFYETSGSGQQVGSISITSSATAFNTSSDQRLKENITDANDAGDKIDAIKVRQYDWKADGSHQDYGMVAQELMTVAPEAVSGDPESDEMMGVDYSKLVPMMLKEIQSLRARVAQLEGAN